MSASYSDMKYLQLVKKMTDGKNASTGGRWESLIYCDNTTRLREEDGCRQTDRKEQNCWYFIVWPTSSTGYIQIIHVRLLKFRIRLHFNLKKWLIVSLFIELGHLQPDSKPSTRAMKHVPYSCATCHISDPQRKFLQLRKRTEKTKPKTYYIFFVLANILAFRTNRPNFAPGYECI